MPPNDGPAAATRARVALGDISKRPEHNKAIGQLGKPLVRIPSQHPPRPAHAAPASGGCLHVPASAAV